MDGDVIKNTCEFEFYHDYMPKAEVLHSDKQLLLANVATPWKLICFEKSNPIRHHGEIYVTVYRNDCFFCMELVQFPILSALP